MDSCSSGCAKNCEGYGFIIIIIITQCFKCLDQQHCVKYRNWVTAQRLQNQVADDSTVVHVHSWTKRAVNACHSYKHSTLHTESTVTLGGSVVRGVGFVTERSLVRYQVTTLGKLFTPICLCRCKWPSG